VTQQIRGQLEALAELMAQEDAIRLQKEALKATVLTDEIRQQLADIDLEFASQEEAVSELIATTRTEVMAAVLTHGASVKAERMQAVWSKPRTKWDTPGLLGFAQAHPEVATFMSVGKASVSLRKL